MSDADMQDVARKYGFESAFVLPAPEDSGCDIALRFWVPGHEMEMCGHATVGSVWLLNQLGMLPGDLLTVWTKSGKVLAHVTGKGADAVQVEISQPQGVVQALSSTQRAEILDVLGITEDEMLPLPIQNAATSRVKTLAPLRSVALLDGLKPDFARMEALCERIGSTGLYPYAISDDSAGVFDARQFPKASGYPEDAATGIAAAALLFGLLQNGQVRAGEGPITVRQGRAMGRPSAINVRFRHDESGKITGCWLSGSVTMEEHNHAH
ncbi:hypothetical protein AGMMS50256_16570 [Betaproteobacteria bacterium]|nr:hypothetical protein AGMMS50256_16570 [Betaproteobacteria bacterium]